VAALDGAAGDALMKALHAKGGLVGDVRPRAGDGGMEAAVRRARQC
jgi:hypothetical protein